jgi:hypothetical protein
MRVCLRIVNLLFIDYRPAPIRAITGARILQSDHTNRLVSG